MPAESEGGLIFRPATTADISFLIEGVVSAEGEWKEGGVCIYQSVFRIDRAEVLALLHNLILHPFQNHPLSYKRFFIGWRGGERLCCGSSWIEAQSGFSSRHQGAYVLREVVGAKLWSSAEIRLKLFSEVFPKRSSNTVQLGANYVVPRYRGQRLFALLVDHVVKIQERINPSVTKAGVVIHEDNKNSILVCEKLGFKVINRSLASDSATRELIGGGGYCQLEKIIHLNKEMPSPIEHPLQA